MKIIIAEEQSKLNNIAYDLIKETIKVKPNAIFGLPTGETPIGLYKIMINGLNENNISYEDITVINLDEYIGIKRNDKNSYYTFMRTNLIDHIDMSLDNFHIPNGSNFDYHLECKNYEDVLENKPRDLQILGLGSNGHIGFNEPGTPFTSKTRIVELNEETRLANARFFKTLEEVPSKALTMGISNILDSKKILLLAYGKKKAEAVLKMLEKPISEDCPASVLRQHENLIVLLDDESASLLSEETLSKAEFFNI